MAAKYNPYTEKIEDEKQANPLAGKFGQKGLMLGLGSSTSLFLAFMAAYMYSKPNWSWTLLSFPKLFLISAVLLGFSSYTIRQIPKAFKADDAQRMKKMFHLTIALTSAFVIAQIMGWGELISENIIIGGKPDGSYLYLISGIHALHVLGGLVPLLIFYFGFIKTQKSSVNSLMYFSKVGEYGRLRLIETYWHFVDVVWVIILLFFLFNHL